MKKDKNMSQFRKNQQKLDIKLDNLVAHWKSTDFTWNKDPQSTFSAHILTENFWSLKTSDELEIQEWWSSE